MQRKHLHFLSAITIVILILLITSTSHGAYIGRLNNGMDVVLVENRSIPMIVCNIVIKVGARDESWETWGATHFLEHLLFNGTTNRSQEEIYAEFDRLGAWHNAHTGSHFTDFMLLVSDENFPTGFEILTDMIFNSNLPAWKFEKERSIVMEEIARSAAMGTDEDRIFREALFGGSALSRSVLGTVESIERLERDSVIAYYHDWYAPNNMLLFASGNFAADTLYSWLQKELSEFAPREVSPHVKLETPDFHTLKDRGAAVRFHDGSSQKLCLSMRAPSPGDPDFPAFYLLNSALERRFQEQLPSGYAAGGGFLFDPDFTVYRMVVTSPEDSALGEELVVSLIEIMMNLSGRPLAGVEAIGMAERIGSILGLSVTELIARLDKVKREARVEALSQDEVTRLARSYRAERVFNSEKLHHYGIMYAAYWALTSWDEWDSWSRRMADLTPEKLYQVAGKWLLDSDWHAVILKPQLKAEVLKENETVGRMKRYSLESGPTMIIRSDPTASVFAMHVLIKNRWLFDREFSAGAVDLLHRMMVEPSGGDEESVTRRLDELSATLKVVDSPFIPFDNYYTTPEYSFVRLEALPDQWRRCVELVGELLDNPTLTEETLESAKVKASTSLQAGKRSAVGSGAKSLKTHLFPGTAWSADVYSDVSKIGLESIKELKKQYMQPRNMIISICGPVEQESVRETLLTVFSRFTSASHSSVGSEQIALLDTSEIDSVFVDSLKLGGEQGAVVMGRNIPSVDSSDQAALVVANAYFNERMAAVLRETLGLAYSLGSSVTFFPRSTTGGELNNAAISAYWQLSIATRQQNLERAEESIQDLINELAEHTFTQSEVERLKNAITGRFLMRSMSQMGQAYYAGMGEFNWGDPNHTNLLIDGIRAVTAEQVEDAARKYMQPGAMSMVIVE